MYENIKRWTTKAQDKSAEGEMMEGELKMSLFCVTKLISLFGRLYFWWRTKKVTLFFTVWYPLTQRSFLWETLVHSLSDHRAFCRNLAFILWKSHDSQARVTWANQRPRWREEVVQWACEWNAGDLQPVMEVCHVCAWNVWDLTYVCLDKDGQAGANVVNVNVTRFHWGKKCW